MAVGVVDAVDSELLVELGAECWVASVEGVDEPAGLFEEASYLLGVSPSGAVCESWSWASAAAPVAVTSAIHCCTMAGSGGGRG